MPAAVKPFSKGYRVQDVFTRNDFSNKPISQATSNVKKTSILIGEHNRSGIRSHINQQEQ